MQGWHACVRAWMRSAAVASPASQRACATRCSCRLWKPPWCISASAMLLHASSCRVRGSAIACLKPCQTAQHASDPRLCRSRMPWLIQASVLLRRRTAHDPVQKRSVLCRDFQTHASNTRVGSCPGCLRASCHDKGWSMCSWGRLVV